MNQPIPFAVDEIMTDKAYIVGNGLADNDLFDANSTGNRDNCHDPYIQLRRLFYRRGFELNTTDVVTDQDTVRFQLHQDVQRIIGDSPAYLLLWETSLILPQNGVVENFKRYRKIFTWRDDLVDGVKYIKIQFANPIHIHSIDGFENRDRFCCLIAGNKTLATQDNRNLYTERVKSIRWFEKHAPQDFDLYGVGWDMSVVHPGLLGRVERRLLKILDRFVTLCPFPSYRGKVVHKRDVLARTRFSICYENVRDLPGYITEKIFDCFFSGCVPVYWGAANITDQIPSDCFVDRRKFRDTAAVYVFLKAMTELEFRGYQQRIVHFLKSDASYPFSSECFAETLVNTIVQDLGD